MVGIVIATHGEFANGILQSASMVFGEQENVKSCTLMPSEGPEDLRKKMEDAINSFENQEQVLFLVDLLGGTPFNQASRLIEQNKNWAIITGLNLNMLIEVFGTRMAVETAHEIALSVLESSKDGIKLYPQELEPKPKVKKAKEEIVEIGNGSIQYVLARIDSRLLHGQVATAWSKATSPNRIIVVSDEVAKDSLRKKLIEQAAPPGIKANVVPISKMIEVSKDPRFGKTKALLLFETPEDALRAIEGGVQIEELNIGSMAHSIGKVAVNKAISLGKEDLEVYDKLKKLGIKFDVRKVPNDSKANMDNLLAKAKAELDKL